MSPSVTELQSLPTPLTDELNASLAGQSLQQPQADASQSASAQLQQKLGLPAPTPSPEMQQLQTFIGEMARRRQQNAARRESAWQSLQRELQPDAIQSYLPKPSAGSILNDAILSFTRANMAHTFGWPQPEPIYQTRLKNAMELHSARMRGLQGVIAETNEADRALADQGSLIERAAYQFGLLQNRDQANAIRDRSNDIRAMTETGPFPQEIADWYSGPIPKAFTDQYPLAAPIRPPSGIITNAELRAITQTWNRDKAALQNWQVRNQPITSMDQLGAKIDTLGLDGANAAQLKAQVGLIYGGAGSYEDKVRAANSAIQKAVDERTRLDNAGRIEAAKVAADAPDLGAFTKNTSTGYRYIDGTGVSGKTLIALKNRAAKAGLPVLSKDGNDAVEQIETARQNQRLMADQLLSRLPKDAAGRVTTGLSNKISQYIQSDQYLASVGTYRIAAIQALRAAAGSKGLRINEAEIRQAVENDIPRVTDTVAVAQQKLANINAMLGNQERSLMGRTTPTPVANPSSIAPPPAPNVRKFNPATGRLE